MMSGDLEPQQQQEELLRLRRGRIKADFAPEGDDEVSPMEYPTRIPSTAFVL